MKKVIVAIDGSEPSYRAAGVAAEIASKCGARLTLTHVLNPLWIPPENYGLNLQAIKDAHLKEATKFVDQAQEKIRSTGLQVDRVILDGVPPDTLAEYAKEEGFDLVAVGSRGQNPISRVLLGSFSGRLAHICEVPLLIVR
jgi:nucleotide-binding universal stress UspA family protein